MKLALGIPHTPWIPERVESMRTLLAGLGLPAHIAEHQPGCTIEGILEVETEVRFFTEKADHQKWSLDMWTWAAETDADWFISLQDDVKVAPNFWPILRAMLKVVDDGGQGDGLLGLEVVHKLAPQLAAEGHRWFTTSDCLIGVGYGMAIDDLRAFLAWCKTELREGCDLTEDTKIAVWSLATHRRIWHPIPTIIDHDTSLRSTYAHLGNELHGSRRPLVRWEGRDEGELAMMGHADYWRGAKLVRAGDAKEVVAMYETKEGREVDPEHVGRFYDVTPALARRWVKSFDDMAYAEARADVNTALMKRLAAQARARRDFKPKASVLIATPTRGNPHPEYNATVWNTLQIADVHVMNAFDVFDTWQWVDDVVRTRSRLVRAFLETDATHLWFLDADVSCSPTALLGMLRSSLQYGREVVATPYPRRDTIYWERLLNNEDRRHPEARAYAYPIGLTAEQANGALQEDAVSEVDWMPLGCSLIARSALERMVKVLPELGDPDKLAHEAMLRIQHGAIDIEDQLLEVARAAFELGQNHPDLAFDDMTNGTPAPTVAIFQLMIRNRRLLSEDQAFCARWRDIGGKVWMYLGPGAPATHHGEHAYRGRIETFGLRHPE